MKTMVAIYTRVSTDNQAELEFNSCEAQEAKIKAFISSQEGMEVFIPTPAIAGRILTAPLCQNYLPTLNGAISILSFHTKSIGLQGRQRTSIT
jgi:hypothetical protein